MASMWTMGRDQCGQYYHNLGKHPRKELLKRLGRQHAQKMYTSFKNGPDKHTGYIIAGLWIELFEVNPWQKDA